MARVICIWLPFWKTDRLERRSGGVKLHEPLPLTVITKGKGGKRLLALNTAAREAGLQTGMLLTDACAMLPSLAAAPRASCSIRADISQSWRRDFLSPGDEVRRSVEEDGRAPGQRRHPRRSRLADATEGAQLSLRLE